MNYKTRKDANGFIYARVGRVHKRRSGGYYMRYHWTCIGKIVE